MHAILHHMALHTWLWASALSAMGGVAIFFKLGTPAAFIFMFVGVLVMMRSEGSSLERVFEEDAFTDAADSPLPEAEAGTPKAA